uniref:Sulfotransferase domain-containing protein n=2 Tax=Photinus pyralis TaxID=7054 RepID=A0A1Y1M8D2_PHOPY
MVWSIKNRANFEGASLNIYQRFPMLEACGLPSLLTTGEPFILNSLEYLGQIKGQRLIKTHLPFSLLPKDIQLQRKSPKIIYVVRNPKDVFISYFNHTRIIDGFKGNLEDFADLFLSDSGGI